MDVEDKTKRCLLSDDGAGAAAEDDGVTLWGSNVRAPSNRGSAQQLIVSPPDVGTDSYFGVSLGDRLPKRPSPSGSVHVSAEPASGDPAIAAGESVSSASLEVKSVAHGLEPTVLVQSVRPTASGNGLVDRLTSNGPNSGVAAIKNRFELIELVGIGGMGAVYKAVDRRKVEASDRDPFVAIKVLNDDFRHHPDAFISLQREARKSQALAHPNIVNVYDFDRDGDVVFMTMEFLRGSPLDVLLRGAAGTGLPSGQAMSVLKDVASALQHAHSCHIVHSDFKPGNIYVTSDKGAKVFDFGIAHAVKPDNLAGGDKESKTLFDAASLGALTPAYASVEMLQGSEPCPRDDVYALACVAYEMFTGRHPFDKTPADQAMRRGLKPKRIRHLSRRQWRALRQALVFTGQRRTASVGEFSRSFFGRPRLPHWWALVPLGLMAALVVWGTGQQQAGGVDQSVIKEELQEELAQTLIRTRAADRLTMLERMLHAEDLSLHWEEDLRTELAEYRQLMPADANTPVRVQKQVAEKLLLSAQTLLQRNDPKGARANLQRASEWGAGQQQVEAVDRLLTQHSEQEQQRLRREAEEEQRRRGAAAASRAEQQRQQQTDTRNRKLTETIARIDNALHCSTAMDIASVLSLHWQALTQLDRSLAQRLLPDVVADIGSCLQRLQQVQPQRAEALLSEAKALFPEAEMLRQLRIDHCAHLEAGSGGRGARFSCQDRLASGGEGPLLVVVESPVSGRIAIGKYEVSPADMKTFCVFHGQCGQLGQLPAQLPASNLPVELAEQFLRWLSAETGYAYRLPDEAEWLAAAAAEQQVEDPDRNCHLRFGAIQKGAELVSVASGKANSNGLLHAVGNVQEWARGGDGSLLAMGGSREDPMSRCRLTTRKQHDGSADATTGFRLLREL